MVDVSVTANELFSVTADELFTTHSIRHLLPLARLQFHVFCHSNCHCNLVEMHQIVIMRLFESICWKCHMHDFACSFCNSSCGIWWFSDCWYSTPQNSGNLWDLMTFWLFYITSVLMTWSHCTLRLGTRNSGRPSTLRFMQMTSRIKLIGAQLKWMNKHVESTVIVKQSYRSANTSHSNVKQSDSTPNCSHGYLTLFHRTM